MQHKCFNELSKAYTVCGSNDEKIAKILVTLLFKALIKCKKEIALKFYTSFSRSNYYAI